MCGCGGQLDGNAMARAVLCLTCRHAGRDPGWWFAWLWFPYPNADGRKPHDPKICRKSDKHVGLHIKGRPCPIGRHRLVGTTRWWYGVPYHLRLVAAVLGASGSALRSVPGCGCFRPAKDAWEGFWVWALGLDGSKG